jgi:signal transduction histidine kinase
MVDPPAGSPVPPNPAADRPWSSDPAGGTAEPMSRPSRHLVRLADRLPDWLGSVRFRLTALYSFLLFGLATFMVAGLYGVLASRLHEETLYRTYEVTRVEPVPGGVVLTPTEVRAQYRSVEQLANERALSLLRSYSLSALVLLFLASLVIGWLVAGRVLAPIGRITGVAREIQATDLSRRIGMRGPPDELHELADTFDAMLARLDEAFAGQQRFIQEASHELRNPLAVIRTNLDVALADPDPDPAELRRVAELARSSAIRMSRLVDDLMIYARLGAPAHEHRPVELGAVVRDVADEFATPAARRSIALAVQAPGPVVVRGDEPALRQALANLVANAVRLAPEATTVTLAVGTDGPEAWMAVVDDGPGLAPGEQELVFQRFWRGDRESARLEGRSGLGLAIVAQIAAEHGGSASVSPSGTGGSAFVVRLPLLGSTPPTAPITAASPSPPTVG